MRVAVIGRTRMLYNCVEKLIHNGHTIPLIVTSRAAPEYEISESDFKLVAEKIGAKFIFTQKINDTNILKEIKSIPNIDVAISINFSGIIDKEIIDVFPFGILNAHGGDLPRYRGNACQAWAILNGESTIGLCIHKMIGGELDSGDILFKKKYPININTRIGEVYNWFEKDIPDLMLYVLNEVLTNKNFKLEPQSKNPNDVLRCYPRIPDDGFINWNNSAVDIIRLINASSEPYSGAFSYINNIKVTIWRASLIHYSEKYMAVPGQVTFIDKCDGNIHVVTGNGVISISDIEIDGKRNSPTNFIKSIRTRFK